ncbi:hypothetical protein [Listeria rustica]|uniref:Uncharacterized protein n=1 Tax=Listeria rustica TaxID=2713503 RepID=A0A7W1T603_9LIST|nr:hypothetical protein [Listeria rustica]MBA3926052.1 hypothetical protein [Listeria rustica]
MNLQLSTKDLIFPGVLVVLLFLLFKTPDMAQGMTYNHFNWALEDGVNPTEYAQRLWMTFISTAAIILVLCVATIVIWKEAGKNE